MKNLDKYLKYIEPQKEVETKQIEIEKNPVLEKIIKIYETWCKFVQETYLKQKYADDWYNEAYELLNELVYTSKEIFEFSINLKKYEKKEQFYLTGLFISALINKSKEGEFEIFTEKLTEHINFIGFKTTKTIKIVGNVGYQLGQYMEGGKIIVEGNSKWNIGEKAKGEIRINGEIDHFFKEQDLKIYHKGELIICSKE